jgi:hypothetical protein
MSEFSLFFRPLSFQFRIILYSFLPHFTSAFPQLALFQFVLPSTHYNWTHCRCVSVSVLPSGFSKIFLFLGERLSVVFTLISYQMLYCRICCTCALFDDLLSALHFVVLVMALLLFCALACGCLGVTSWDVTASDDFSGCRWVFCASESYSW